MVGHTTTILILYLFSLSLQCLPNTFYLSVNVQLTLIFYPIVMIMNQRPKIATHLLLVIVVCSICYSGFVTYDSDLFGMILPDQLTNLE